MVLVLGILGAQCIGAAGTRNFEPDGVVFCDVSCDLARLDPETQSKNGPARTKPLSRRHEASRKRARHTLDPDQQRGSMCSFIINLAHARSCEKCPASLPRHRHAWI
jgi:hypothetical protein